MGQKDVETPVGIGVLLSTYTTLNYKWRHAIGELVDNSVDSYLQHTKEFPEGIDIYIDYDSSAKTLCIADTAYGMNFDDMNRAVQITRNNDHEYFESGIGRYGLGMKKSATFLGPKWKLISKSKESKLKYTVSVDVKKLAKNNAKKLTIVDAPSNAKHGTRLEINLAKTMKGTAEQTVKNHLCEMYKRYMEKDQIRIWWNDDQLEYSQPQIRVSKVGDIDTTWSTDLKFEIQGESGNKHEISGTLYILQTMSHTDSGIQLFNSNRMIIGGSGSPNENWR
ncbi:ATP-binding protein, partial [Candidatus Poseidoniales archaeon]|nr:ATP-binding protein [Candidatus Poseidoniales archaeon]